MALTNIILKLKRTTGKQVYRGGKIFKCENFLPNKLYQIVPKHTK